MQMNIKQSIFGLNSILNNTRSFSDVMYGESSVYHIEREITCDHGL